VADFNGDGIPDLAVANLASMTILLGNGDGTFNAAPSLPASGSVAVADFNGDGIPDLWISGAVFLGNGDGTFTIPAGPLPFGSAGASIVVADFNGMASRTWYGVVTPCLWAMETVHSPRG